MNVRAVGLGVVLLASSVTLSAQPRKCPDLSGQIAQLEAALTTLQEQSAATIAALEAELAELKAASEPIPEPPPGERLVTTVAQLTEAVKTPGVVRCQGVFETNVVFSVSDVTLVGVDIPDGTRPAVGQTDACWIKPLDRFQPVFSTVGPVKNITISGLRFDNGAPDRDATIFGSPLATIAEDQPSGITMRATVSVAGPEGGHRAVRLDTNGNVKILYNHFANYTEFGRESQCIFTGNATGSGYLIEGNYLECSGENIMFGGSDPKIQGAVPTDVVVRKNEMVKPLSWKDPILPAPANVTATADTGGTLAAGQYSYRIVAVKRTSIGATAYSPRSTEVLASVSEAGQVSLTWDAVPTATSYRVYRGAAVGQQTQYFTATGPSFTDNGGTVGTADTGNWIGVGTRWTVKNIFELKNAKNVLVEQNLLKGNWNQAQDGSPVMISPRNQDGKCPWCGVEDAVFVANVIEDAPQGHCFSIAGRDSRYPTASHQTQRIRIEGNLCKDAISAIALEGAIPGELAIVRNTFPAVSERLLRLIGGAANPLKTNLRFEFNVSRGGQYGIFGEGTTGGTSALDAYAPGYVWQGNVIEKSPIRPWLTYPTTGTELLNPGLLAPRLDPVTFKYLPGGAGY